MTNDVLDDRFVLREDDGTWWEIGWDRHLATYWAQHLTTDAYGVEQILAWHGADPHEAPTINVLTNAMRRPLPRNIAQDLQRSRLADQTFKPVAVSLSDWTQERAERRVPHVDFGSRWIDPARPDVEQRVSWVPTTGELYAVDRRSGDGLQLLAVLPTHDDVTQALEGWAAVAASDRPEVTWLQNRVENVGIDTPAGVETTAEPTAVGVRLPAAPAAAALASFVGGPGVDDDPLLISRGLNLDADLVGGLLAGTTTELGVDEIAAVCEAFHCSPYDLWEPAVARNILHAYGPEKWPRHIEPLEDLRHENDDRFIGRRLDAQAEQIVSLRTQLPAGAVHATCYRATGVLSLDPMSGSTQRISDGDAPPAPDHEYHFTFRQIAGTFALRNEGAFHPDDLALLADRLRSEPWLARTSLVRFVEPATGEEQWLGKVEPGVPWETWDDPRRYYPGSPCDVLDASIYAGSPEMERVNEVPGAPDLPTLDL